MLIGDISAARILGRIVLAWLDYERNTKIRPFAKGFDDFQYQFIRILRANRRKIQIKAKSVLVSQMQLADGRSPLEGQLVENRRVRQYSQNVGQDNFALRNIESHT